VPLAITIIFLAVSPAPAKRLAGSGFGADLLDARTIQLIEEEYRLTAWPYKFCCSSSVVLRRGDVAVFRVVLLVDAGRQFS
jgi:hypothetical protein